MIGHKYEVSGPFIVVALLLGASIAVAQQPTVDHARWLQGCWQSVRGEATIEEQWMGPLGGTMLGMFNLLEVARDAEKDAAKKGKAPGGADPADDRQER